MKALVRVGILATALLLSACGGGEDTTATESTSDQSLVTETAAPTVEGAFGAPLDLGNGVTVTISEPKGFTPGQFASNFVPGQTANIVDITVKNGGTAELDLASILYAAESGTNYCVDVLDGDNGVNGAPMDVIAAGASSTFTYAVACDAKAGDPLKLSVTLNEDVVSVEGTLA